ncbi:MAG: Hydroperoxy fatty acid reductase gpx1 [Tenericutes bacterium ADurb.BinA155]|jgi:glutathione peroxidase|nr:MAG: Hydroperoxy fatty acid reductase gpx1 [Tenericutes bacterium ADurb.BinA155]
MSLLQHQVKGLKGEPIDLAQYQGQVVLIVNTATKCGFTPQYKGLEELYQKYKAKGFVILDFPCNQFFHQAPGENEEIHDFCTLRYKTSFPQFGKIEVNGKKADPLYQELTDKKASKFGGRIPWNFTKFLLNRNGEVVGRFAPPVTPEEIAPEIEKLL